MRGSHFLSLSVSLSLSSLSFSFSLALSYSCQHSNQYFWIDSILVRISALIEAKMLNISAKKGQKDETGKFSQFLLDDTFGFVSSY
jgi:hypothetical protein